MLKISMLGDVGRRDFRECRHVAEPHSLGHAVICFYVYPVYLYFNFSGYTDVMIGAAADCSASSCPRISIGPTWPATSWTSGIVGTSASRIGSVTMSS